MSTSHVSGGAEWMHTLGFGPLDEEDDDGAAQTAGSVRRPAQQTAGQDHDVPAGPSQGATPGAGVATQCAKCGQLALLAVGGRCQCEVMEAADV